MQRGQLHLYCQNYSSLPAHRSGSHFYSLCLVYYHVWGILKTRTQGSKRKCSFQRVCKITLPVLPPSHDRLNSATCPRAGIAFVALSSRRLYSIPRPYICSPVTGCFNIFVSHTKSCPFLCSFLACYAYVSTNAGLKTQMQVFENTNTALKWTRCHVLQNTYEGLKTQTKV